MSTIAAQDVSREITNTDPRLYNEDLAPVKQQTWKAYNIFVFWMSDVHQHGFLGLSVLGWAGFLILWVLQAVVFWNGMETIKRFIDVAGPAVYVVMFVLAAYMV
jgi:cytosine/uracil/thiamine/allantoin permease